MNAPNKLLKLDKGQIFNLFFLGILLFLIYQLIKILSPFTSPLLISLMLTLTFYPMHLWIKKHISKNRNTSALISSSIVIITAILPMILLGWLLFNETKTIYPKTNAWIARIPQMELSSISPKLKKLKPYITIDTREIISKNLQTIQQKIIQIGGKVLKNVIFIFVNFVVVILTLFFFFKDGDKWLSWIIDMAPMDSEHTHKIAQRLYTMILAIVKGFILTAVIQGLIAIIGYSIASVPSPILMGVLTSIAALIPFGGTTLVWAPIAIIMFITASKSAGIFLFFWGALVIGLTDNFLRPIFIGKKTKLPILLLFLGLFGGLMVYGPIGMILGPLLISCLIVFLEIYRKEISINWSFDNNGKN
ncbi:MAG: AI-2E family transporter [Elusimicrobia bacterium]|nr:AI-2E family transporter [Elusimicrobiota bacterium]